MGRSAGRSLSAAPAAGAVPFHVDWRPQGDFALLAGDFGAICECDGAVLAPLASPPSSPLYGVAFSPGGDQAVIVEYGGAFIVYGNGGDICEGAAWKSDSAEALVAGDEGGLAVYHKTPSILGRIHCGKENYVAGKTMKTFVDLENNGSAPCAVDACVSLRAGYGRRLWWPKFGAVPFAVTLNLKPGASISGCEVFETVIGPVTNLKNFVWEFWILEPGSMTYESVLSYSPFQG